MTSIYDIKELKEIKKRVDEIEAKVTTPHLTDTDNLPKLLTWYKEITGEAVIKVEERQKFLFIVLSLYCPRYFAGYTLNRGLRIKIAEMFKLSPSHISNLLRDVDFLYANITNFKKTVTYTIPKMMERIKNARFV